MTILTARCLSPFCVHCDYSGHVRTLPVTWGRTVVYSGTSISSNTYMYSDLGQSGGFHRVLDVPSSLTTGWSRYSLNMAEKVTKIRNSNNEYFRSSNSIVGYAVVYILRLIGHTHDRESPIQNFSTAPKKLGAHISSPVWPPKPTEFVSYLGNLRCDAFTALKSIQSARNESFLAGSDNFHRVLTAI